MKKAIHKRVNRGAYYFGNGPSRKSKEIVNEDTNITIDTIDLDVSTKKRGLSVTSNELTAAIKNTHHAIVGNTSEQAARLLDELFGERRPIAVNDATIRHSTACAWIFEKTEAVPKSYCCRPTMASSSYCGFHASISVQRGWYLLGKYIVHMPKELTGTEYQAAKL